MSIAELCVWTFIAVVAIAFIVAVRVAFLPREDDDHNESYL